MIHYFWLIVISLLLLVFIVIPAVVIWRLSMRIPEDAGRRRFLKKAVSYPVGLAAASGYGYGYERCHTVDNRYRIPMAAGAFPEGYRLAQISDVHLGRFFSVAELRRLLERIASDGPDLLAITGDLFDDEGQNPAAAQLLDEYVDRFPDGIWYCLGNHEHFRGVTEIKRLLSATRVHALYNHAEQVPGKSFWIAGTDHPMIRETEKFRQLKAEYFAQTIEDIPEKERKSTIVLAHHPEFIDNAAAAGIPLTLTGHTHGSQFGIFDWPLFPVFKYTRGMVRLGDSYGYVHVGNGSWFPCRIGCPPEVAYFEFRG